MDKTKKRVIQLSVAICLRENEYDLGTEQELVKVLKDAGYDVLGSDIPVSWRYEEYSGEEG